jgi:hypothetical protein
MATSRIPDDLDVVRGILYRHVVLAGALVARVGAVVFSDHREELLLARPPRPGGLLIRDLTATV